MGLNFKAYTGTKNIIAAPMTKIDTEKILGNTTNLATLGKDGYLVVYTDGHRSWLSAKDFEAVYRSSETHIDRMKIELEELNERICKATRVVNTLGVLSAGERRELKEQLQAMRKYADCLYGRISAYTESMLARSVPACDCEKPVRSAE